MIVQYKIIKHYTYEEPFKEKPEWIQSLITTNKMEEYAPDTKGKKNYYRLKFSDKRSTHECRLGDTIIFDEFGRIDVFSARNFEARKKRQR